MCDPQYTGEQCGVMSLRRAKLDNGMQVNGTHTWGGHALKDESSGQWVGYFSYMAGGCDLGVWGSQSMIIKATADAPDGPYVILSVTPRAALATPPYYLTTDAI